MLEKCLNPFYAFIKCWVISVSLILRSEFPSYSSLNWANIQKDWMSLWFLMGWASKEVQISFFACRYLEEVQE